MRLLLAAAVLGGAVALVACGDDSTGTGSRCEVIFAASNPPGSGGIEVHNDTGGGLSVQVDGGGFAGTGSDMNAGDCNVWAFPAGTYSVELRRCSQENPGESSCTGFIGSAVVRSVTVEGTSRSVLRVEPSFFP
jgi:hypothetical protein